MTRGRSTAFLPADRVDSIAREREANPATAAQVAAEKDAIAARNVTFVPWITSKMGWPAWLALAILCVPNWYMTNMTVVPRSFTGGVLLVDLVVIVGVVVLWQTRGRAQ